MRPLHHDERQFIEWADKLRSAMQKARDAMEAIPKGVDLELDAYTDKYTLAMDAVFKSLSKLQKSVARQEESLESFGDMVVATLAALFEHTRRRDN